jgi:type I restriction enzyme S subunit
MSKAQIKDVAFLITKGTTPTTMGEKFVSSGVNFIKAESLSFSKHINQSVFEHIDKDTDEKLKRSRLEKDDLLFSIAGYLGKMGIVREVDLPANTNQAVAIIRLDKSKIDVDYLYYYLAQNHIQGYINRLSSQSVQPNLNLELLGKLEFENRKIGEQQKIAAVLSALDTKIELNQRINAELESMAKTVFRYQFVENKEKGNWKIGTLGDVAENIRRSANPSDISPETHYIGLEHMPRKSIALAEYGNASELESNKYTFKTGEFLFGKLRPYFHKVGIAPVDGVCSTDILVISPKSPEWYGFVLGHISSDEIIKYADATSGGTKMPRTNWESLAKFEISMPPVELAKQFTDFFVPIAKQIRTNILESQTLTELRDWLLPMLMNGQVKVN